MQLTKSKIFTGLVIAFLLVLSIVSLYRNVELSRSIETLKAEVANARDREPAPIIGHTDVAHPSLPRETTDAESQLAGQQGIDQVSPDDQHHLAEINEALAAALLETMEDLEQEFAAEAVDPVWSGQQAIRIQTEFVDIKPLLNYQITNLVCRTTMCKGLIKSLDGQPFDDFGVSVGAALTKFESADLIKMNIDSLDSDSAQIFFRRNTNQHE